MSDLSFYALQGNAIVFNESNSTAEVIRVDSNGFHYRGQFIADAGEAHRLLVEFLRAQQPERNWRHATIGEKD